MCPLPPPLCFAMQNIGLENTDSGGDRVRSPLPLLVTDEIECPQGEGVKKYPQKKQRRILTFGGLERNIKNEYNR